MANQGTTTFYEDNNIYLIEVGDYRNHMEKFQKAEKRLIYKVHAKYEKRVGL